MTLLPLVVAAALAAAGAAPLDVGDYRERLRALEATLLSGDRPAAAQEARALLQRNVRWGDETLPVDGSVLLPMTDVHREGVAAPLHALIAALSSARQEAPGPRLDRRALAALALGLAERPAKGSADETSLAGLPFHQQLRGWVQSAGSWVKARLQQAWRWLLKWFRKWWAQRPEGEEKASAHLVVPVVVGVGLILLLVGLAALLGMRGRRPEPSQERVAPAKDVDTDVLSRSGDGWVERAQALSRDGRYREAIRAWYHALLVSCYRSGLLHHRPGLTNWEYARSLGQDVPWRGQFAELTGRFDLEWYGRAQSSAEALESFAGETGVLLGLLHGAQP